MKTRYGKSDQLLRESERWTLLHCLAIAADRFEIDAQAFQEVIDKKQYGAGQFIVSEIAAARLRDQFKLQAKEARELRGRIEDARDVTLEYDEDYVGATNPEFE